MEDKELIYKEEAIDAIVESEYFFLDSDGHGVKREDRRSAAEAMLKNTKSVVIVEKVLVERVPLEEDFEP